MHCTAPYPAPAPPPSPDNKPLTALEITANEIFSIPLTQRLSYTMEIETTHYEALFNANEDYHRRRYARQFIHSVSLVSQADVGSSSAKPSS